MIKSVSVRNIALIDKVELELGARLNILSGETGAGKSLIIDSLGFVLGERADRGLIRYGTDHAVVEAVFEDYLTPDVEAYLDDMGIEPEDVLVIRRKMTADGKNECRINGRATTLSVLKGLTELLVDIHGQHEHQSLIKPANHEGMLDGIGGKDILSARDKVGALHAEYRALKEEFSRFGDESERARRLDVLRFQLEEIERADIAEGEEEELLEKRKRIRNTEKILSALSSARSALEGYDGASVGGNLKAAAASLHTISTFDEGIEPLCDRLDAAKTEIEDIGETLGDMMREFDFDAKSADAVEERLETVRNLQRKYGGSYAAMREFYDKAAAEADTLANASERVEALEREISAKGKELSAAAEKLGALRRKTAESFERAIMKELGDLGMGGTTFKVDIARRDVPLYARAQKHRRGHRPHRHHGVRRDRHRHLRAHFRRRRGEDVQHLPHKASHRHHAYAVSRRDGGQPFPHRKGGGGRQDAHPPRAAQRRHGRSGAPHRRQRLFLPRRPACQRDEKVGRGI